MPESMSMYKCLEPVHIDVQVKYLILGEAASHTQGLWEIT